jgi:hypothetical protein
LRIKNTENSHNIEFLKLTDFVNFFSVDTKIVEFVASNIEKLQKSNIENSEKIKDVIGKNANILRLIILIFLIDKYRPDYFVETGTQHGVSSFLVGEYILEKNIPTTVFTFDVKSDLLVGSSNLIHYRLLNEPIRTEFKIETQYFTGKSTLFFHDSDHSKENMLFELSWMWDIIGVDILVSDDISGNSAFFEFCSLRNLKAYSVSNTGEPDVGFVIRTKS